MPLKTLRTENMPNPLPMLTHDGHILFVTRFVRLFSYGFLSVILVLYLTELGFDGKEFGLILTLTLIGDTVISLWLTTTADRLGRKRVLIVGAVLMLFAGMVFSFTKSFWILTIAAVFGVISPSGKEVGPFLSIEQAALSQTVSGRHRTRVFAWYNLVGSMASALDALAGGFISQILNESGVTLLDSYRSLVVSRFYTILPYTWLFDNSSRLKSRCR